MTKRPPSIREAARRKPVDLPGDRRQRVVSALLENLVALVFTPRSWFYWKTKH